MTYVLMDTYRGYVVGVGPSDKTCPECGHSGTARGGFHIDALRDDPDGLWEVDEYATAELTEYWTLLKDPDYRTYIPVPLATLKRLLQETQP